MTGHSITDIIIVQGEVKATSSQPRMAGHIMANTTSYQWAEYVSAMWSYGFFFSLIGNSVCIITELGTF